MKKDTGTGKGTGTGAELEASGTGTGTDVKKKGGRPKGSKSGYARTAKGLEKQRENMGIIPFETDEEKNHNSMIIRHSLECYEISRKADVNKPETLVECFRDYLVLCEKNGMRIGNIGACTAMGINYKVLNMWKNGQSRSNNPEYKRIADMVSGICAMSREELINKGDLHPVIGIFWQRNYDGLRNDTEQIQQQTDIDNDSTTATEYRKKYGDLIDD